MFYFKGVFILCLALLVVGCSGGHKQAHTPRSLNGFTGVASWYGPGFQGRRTASGERFNMHKFTCAHKSLPFGTELEVTHLSNGKSVAVRVNDRGPFVRGRVLDLSYAAAQKIGLVGSGHAPVRARIVKLHHHTDK